MNSDNLNSAESGALPLPLVTVVICVYNAGDYLRPSLLSILEQTYHNLDILIIDDGSTDGCFESVQDLLTDSRVRVVHQANSTRPVALNRALALVRGEFYAIHDADDISHPRRIESQLDAMRKHPALAAVFCGNELIIEGRSIAPVSAYKGEVECKREIDMFCVPAHDPTGMFRMSIVGSIRYDASLPFVEAFDYVLRVGEQYPMMVLGECLYSYRILSNSVTRRDPTRRDRFVVEALKRACFRRGLEYDSAFPLGPRNGLRSKNSMFDNNIAAFFMKSVLDQTRTGNRRGALRTGWACIRLHPFDLHYYKAFIYALAPASIVKSSSVKKPI
jgi:glycosyltransferase involved in cell wall biosynthesis